MSSASKREKRELTSQATLAIVVSLTAISTAFPLQLLWVEIVFQRHPFEAGRLLPHRRPRHHRHPLLRDDEAASPSYEVVFHHRRQYSRFCRIVGNLHRLKKDHHRQIAS